MRMELGLTFDKLLLIGIVAVLIVGPERLPKAAETFARFVRRAGEYLRDTRSRMRDELGPEIDEVDWRKLDPRQYDPRRIIRDALFEEPSFDAKPTPAPSAAAARMARAVIEDSGQVIPVCAWVDGEYGINGVYLGVEAEIGREGVKKIVERDLTDSELAGLKEAAEAVRAKQSDIAEL